MQKVPTLPILFAYFTGTCPWNSFEFLFGQWQVCCLVFKFKSNDLEQTFLESWRGMFVFLYLHCDTRSFLTRLDLNSFGQVLIVQHQTGLRPAERGSCLSGGEQFAPHYIRTLEKERERHSYAAPSSSQLNLNRARACTNAQLKLSKNARNNLRRSGGRTILCWNFYQSQENWWAKQN